MRENASDPFNLLLALCLSGLAIAVPRHAARADTNKAPDWAKPGVFVYRVSTPDTPDVLPGIEAGTALTSHLLDGTVRQIIIMNGVVGHDHPGKCNWDGLWPDWNRLTFRANHDWSQLDAFMLRERDQYNAYPTFHVNLTDVNAGLGDYPESRAFFEKLVAAKALYRREWNPVTRKRDSEPPTIPSAIPANADPISIFALVNYKNFWDSGLAKGMIDEFYGRLPYAPPLLYLDVLTLGGGNFATGYPDGPLGGSEATQREGRQAIVDYLRQKGTYVATEGSNTMDDVHGTYAWLHGRAISNDDYSQIAGGNRDTVYEETVGGAGGFNVSPIAVTPAGLEGVRAHYRNLLAGVPDTKVMPGLATAHVCVRTASDEFDIPGTGDMFRGDYADLVDNFYLETIQELYHIGTGATRQRDYHGGVIHVRQFLLTGADGIQQSIDIPSFLPEPRRTQAMADGQIMLEAPITTQVTCPQAGSYDLKLRYTSPSPSVINIYANDQVALPAAALPKAGPGPVDLDLGQITLKSGANTITLDSGPISAPWTDGTSAIWTTPYLDKGLTVTNGDVTFARDYDRMWPDSWSGQKKLYFFSWDGCDTAWTLPMDWAGVSRAELYPLTPDGRGKAVELEVVGRVVRPRLVGQVPYVLVPGKP